MKWFAYERRFNTTAALIICLLAADGCGIDDREAFAEVQAAVSQAQTADPRVSIEGALAAYQEVVDAATRYLTQHPDGNNAAEVKDAREKYSNQLSSLREEAAQYRNTLRKEIKESQPQLPSECSRMAGMWGEYVDRFPKSRLADLARQKKARWETKQQEEVRRGFQIVIEDALVRPIKGVPHGLTAGRSWDPEMFGASCAPDPYAVIVINGSIEAYTAVVRDSLHPVWRHTTRVFQVSDDQEVTIAVRDRDLVEDDDICRWTGSIRELVEKGATGLGRIGDCEQLRARVTRPR